MSSPRAALAGVRPGLLGWTRGRGGAGRQPVRRHRALLPFRRDQPAPTSSATTSGASCLPVGAWRPSGRLREALRNGLVADGHTRAAQPVHAPALLPCFHVRPVHRGRHRPVLRAAVQREVCSKPLADNYFLSQFLFSSYLPCAQGQPRYRPWRATPPSSATSTSWLSCPPPLQALQRAEGLDAFFLSNVFDWANPDEGTAIADGVLAAKASRAVLLYRKPCRRRRHPHRCGSGSSSTRSAAPGSMGWSAP